MLHSYYGNKNYDWITEKNVLVLGLSRLYWSITNNILYIVYFWTLSLCGDWWCFCPPFLLLGNGLLLCFCDWWLSELVWKGSNNCVPLLGMVDRVVAVWLLKMYKIILTLIIHVHFPRSIIISTELHISVLHDYLMYMYNKHTHTHTEDSISVHIEGAWRMDTPTHTQTGNF